MKDILSQAVADHDHTNQTNSDDTDKCRSKYAVVIPAFNEVKTIEQVVTGALRQCPWVIVIDDASVDNTAAIVSGMDATLLRHDVNKGKAGTLWTGLRYALDRGATAVITLDGDGQHNPQDIKRLVVAADHNPRHIIIAARAINTYVAPALRRLANRFADFWISWASGYRIVDSQSGFRLYPTELLKQLDIPHHNGRNFVFESEILIEAARLNIRAVATPIASVYRINARHSHYRPWADTSAIVAMVAKKLLLKGLYPLGLFNSLRIAPVWYPQQIRPCDQMEKSRYGNDASNPPDKTKTER